VVTGPFQENTFIITDSVTGEAVFIDPGDDSDILISEINKSNLHPLAIINTHAHIDHIGAVFRLQSEWNIPFYLHKNEQMVLDTFEQTRRLFGLPVSEKPMWIIGSIRKKIWKLVHFILRLCLHRVIHPEA